MLLALEEAEKKIQSLQHLVKEEQGKQVIQGERPVLHSRRGGEREGGGVVKGDGRVKTSVVFAAS